MACTPLAVAGNIPLALRLPRPGGFHIDIACHPDTENVRLELEELRKACGFFKIPGTYPVDVH